MKELRQLIFYILGTILISSCVVDPQSFTEATNIISSNVESVNSIEISSPSHSSTNTTIKINFYVVGDHNQNAVYSLKMCDGAACNIEAENDLKSAFGYLGPFQEGKNTITINENDFSGGILPSSTYRAQLSVSDSDGTSGTSSYLFENIVTTNTPGELKFVNAFRYRTISPEWDARDIVLHLKKGVGVDVGLNEFIVNVNILDSLDKKLGNYNETLGLDFFGDIPSGHITLPEASDNANAGFLKLTNLNLADYALKDIKLQVTVTNTHGSATSYTVTSDLFQVGGHTQSDPSTIVNEFRSIYPNYNWKIDKLETGLSELRLEVVRGYAWFRGTDSLDSNALAKLNYIGAGDIILYDTLDTGLRTNAIAIITGVHEVFGRTLYSIQSLKHGRHPRNTLTNTGTSHFIISKVFTNLYSTFSYTTYAVSDSEISPDLKVLRDGHATFGYEGEMSASEIIDTLLITKSKNLVSDSRNLKIILYGDYNSRDIPSNSTTISDFTTSPLHQIHLLTPLGKNYSKISFRHKGNASGLDVNSHFYIYNATTSNRELEIKNSNVIVEGIYFKGNTYFIKSVTPDIFTESINNVHIRSNIFAGSGMGSTTFINLLGVENYFIYFNQFLNIFDTSNAQVDLQYGIRIQTSPHANHNAWSMKPLIFNNSFYNLTHSLYIAQNNDQSHEVGVFNNLSFGQQGYFDFIYQDFGSGDYSSGIYEGAMNFIRSIEVANNPMDLDILGDNRIIASSSIFESFIQDIIIGESIDLRSKQHLLLKSGNGNLSPVRNIDFKESLPGNFFDSEGRQVDLNSLPIGSDY